MVLTVNIGNTVISIGGFKEDQICFTASIETRKKATSFEYANSFLQLFSLFDVDLGKLEGAVMSSVVPMLTEPVKEALQLILKKKVLVVSAGVKTGLNIRGNRNINLGADLVSTAVGAAKEYPMPCVIVSFGTATTFVALDEKGTLLGTSIAPGLQTSLEALREKASCLPEIELDSPGDVIGCDTAQSMKSGIFYGTACMCDGMCRRFEKLLGENTTFVTTGRYAKKLFPLCEKDYVYDEHLLLKGLNQIYHRNKKL